MNVFHSVLDKFQALIQLKDPNAAAQTKLVSFNVRNQDHTDQRAGLPSSQNRLQERAINTRTDVFCIGLMTSLSLKIIFIQRCQISD
jgi:hypothetical protein